MNLRICVLTIVLCSILTRAEAAKDARAVEASKGSLQITLRLHDVNVKKGKSLWYQIRLKNVGKTKIRVPDWIFKDPWAMHHNSSNRRGIYLEVIRPNGKPLWVRRGGGDLTWDYVPKPGDRAILTPDESKELEALQAAWKKNGVPPAQQSIALSEWNSKHHERMQRAELGDPAKQLWLKPGASTTTITWAYREPNPDEFTDHSREEAQVGEYTQLWSYVFSDLGKHRIRVVYDYDQSESTKKLFKKHGEAIDPGWMLFKTLYLDFTVTP